MKLGGQSSGGASDGYIHYGDLFFNFTGEDLADAQGNLFAIKFDAGNDSGVVETGVYGNVTSKNLSKQNSGFKSVKSHYDRVLKHGTSPNMGQLGHYEQLDDGDYYFQQGDRKVSTSISTGTILGGIEMIENPYEALGLNFQSVNAAAQGKHTFAFSFARDLIGDGDYVAHLFAECMNDGMAITGTLPRIEVPEGPEDVPEPALVTGLVLMGGLGLLKKGRKGMAAA